MKLISFQVLRTVCRHWSLNNKCVEDGLKECKQGNCPVYNRLRKPKKIKREITMGESIINDLKGANR